MLGGHCPRNPEVFHAGPPDCRSTSSTTRDEHRGAIAFLPCRQGSSVMTRGNWELWLISLPLPPYSPVPILLVCGPWSVLSSSIGRKRMGAVVSWRGESDRLRNTHASYRENLVPYVRDLKPSGFLYHIWNFTDPLKPCAGCSTPKSTSDDKPKTSSGLCTVPRIFCQDFVQIILPAYPYRNFVL